MNFATDEPLIIAVAAIMVYLTALAISRFTMYAKILPDNPNTRSSHDRVTSRAGGVGIFIAWAVGMLIFGAFSGTPAVAILTLKFIGVALSAFLVGLADDKWALAPVWKLAGQLLAASLFVWAFGVMDSAPLPLIGQTSISALAGLFITVIWIVGFMNVFNFMDGVNGIAAGTASIGLIAFAILCAFVGALNSAVVALLLAVACFGFLPANLKRGRLFMGDSGSLTISCVIAALGIYAINDSGGAIGLFSMPVIFLPFIFDVLWTLGHRTLRKQNIVSPHREHLYQLLLRQGYSHAKVAIIYMSLTALSASAAVCMVALEPNAQWIVPAALATVFLFGALQIYTHALKKGLLATPIRDANKMRDYAQ